MTSLALAPRAALAALPAAAADNGLFLRERTDVRLAHVAARRGERFQNCFGVALPEEPRIAAIPGYAFVWAGPRQWLAVIEGWAGEDVEARFAAEMGGEASVTDQSDGRVLIELDGPNLREALAKLVPIDLHPRAFPEGAAALTHAALIGVQLWRRPGESAFSAVVLRSYAETFARWLLAAGAA